ncbi:TetR/AcrR family transcriptional regulator [Streptantibioticus cattleyicolor]|uniref:Transcriptional regulator, TetR family n=1 Tax=Streptantibioticus cattleyicolor (strain ATCC 35852 / DSM 46488 / JCM 4925 / NBRC 14057 / NRRL 8057) TaxID=1003195 RepID=F8JNA1_STREN|nr:TetR/AcrR family transcriptional regulator [Streptantibioticus cattleyicolor]AEW99139.1 transcriptional regulator, TetR family [Streptantibioticus cattleyicolor NRRL 8057 = DSM 46488]CCB71818.1 Transcriptional regulator [Streptantibioticus cattleyicolor NRRL 8057 = DSM 46488]
MAERKARSDAERNRQAVIAAADELFARGGGPRGVSMDDVAAAAGVGKGTLFRGFGDRTGLILAVVEARIEPLRQAVENGPPPLGPDTPPRERVPAVLDAILRFKFDNRQLSLALEEAGRGSPYQAGHYAWWHRTLRDALRRLPDATDADSDFTAHALLAAVRADLVEHLAAKLTLNQVAARLAEFTARLLDAPRR